MDKLRYVDGRISSPILYILQVDLEDTEGYETAYWDYKLETQVVTRVMGVYDSAGLAREGLRIAMREYDVLRARVISTPLNAVCSGQYDPIEA